MKDTKYYTICGYTDVDKNHKSFTTITENTIPLKLKVGLTEGLENFCNKQQSTCSSNFNRRCCC